MKYAFLLSTLLFSVMALAVPRPISTQEITLKPGWNMVTIAQPLDNANNNVEKFLQLKPYTFDKRFKTLSQCVGNEDVKAGVGYWIYSETEMTIELVQDVAQTNWSSAEATTNWNLLGKTEKSQWQANVTSIWEWKNGRYYLVPASQVESGKAYWVFKSSGR